MMVHELKVYPRFMRALFQGIKMFEVRFNDRDFKVGDLVILNQWPEPVEGGYLDLDPEVPKKLPAEICYILDDFPDGLVPGFVVLGLKPATRLN